MTTILTYLSIPIISGLIGWLTNMLAVKMIFRPRRAVRILGFEIIGLIPKRRLDLARKIGETVEQELLSHRDIQQAVNNPAFHNEIGRVLRVKIDEFMLKYLGSNPLIAMFLTGEVASSIKEALVSEIEKMIPQTLEMLLGKLEDRLDFKQIVQSKIEHFELEKLEAIIHSIAARELKAIEILGGVLGFAVGLVQLAILYVGRIYG
jgi:uncharacterized membrane protein YheB (UPF0754 family)